MSRLDFEHLNQLLRQYAQLPIDPDTGNALDREAEKTIIEAIRNALELRVRIYVRKVGRRCTEDVRQQVEQGFWVVFLEYLHRRRLKGKTPEEKTVTVTAGKFIFLFVKYALHRFLFVEHVPHRRAFSPMEYLNFVIHRLIQNAGEDPTALRHFLRETIERCLIELAVKQGLAADRNKLTVAERNLIDHATDVLEARFHDDGIWHTPVWPVEPERMPGGLIPEYVDWERFAHEALPPLGGAPAAAAKPGKVLGDVLDWGPGGENPFRNAVWGSSDRMKSSVTARCRSLSQSASAKVLTKNLRRLFVLLCLPYFVNELLFCSHYGVAGSTKNDDKVFWAEVLVGAVPQACLRHIPRQAIILWVSKNFVAVITPLIEYGWLWIPPEVRLELSRLCSEGNSGACAALEAWWKLASGQAHQLGRPDFSVTEVKNLPLDDLVSRREGQDGLHLERRGKS